ncbi:MAG TPA: hypothetical protein VK585_02320 [Jiangellaceae bacterium]|nr:hypothetical protein [Jiangellaceae bacterium]
MPRRPRHRLRSARQLTFVQRIVRRRRIQLAVLAMPTLLLALDLSVLYLALPQLAANLNADSTQQL